MNSATFEFYGNLLELLPHPFRRFPLTFNYAEHNSIKHLVESLGIPHTEVAAVSISGRSATLTDLLPDRSNLQVYPHGYSYGYPSGLEAVGFDPGKKCEPEPDPRFLLDNHLGRLASYLRLTGFDTLYDRDSTDAELAEAAIQTGRILLTRDRRLLMRKQLDRGYLVRTFKAQEQVLEVIRRYHLHDLIQPFQRCLTCNSLLVTVEKAEILERLQPLTRRYFDEFVFCPVCSQVFWKGSHYERMLAFIETALMS